MVLVHGYGADEHDLAPLAPLYDPGGEFFAVCPRGPNSVFPYGAGWYDRDDDGNIDEAGFVASIDRLDATIDQQCHEQGLDRAESVIIGFSQGGAATLAVSLRQSSSARPAAIACLSGMLQEPPAMPYAWGADGLPPVYVQHGAHDPMVSIDRGHHEAQVHAKCQRFARQPKHTVPTQIRSHASATSSGSSSSSNGTPKETVTMHQCMLFRHAHR